MLAATTAACTAAEVHRRLRRGSDEGVRRVLLRLVGQGVVVSDETGRYPLYRFNRDHVAAPHIEALANLRGEIIERIRTEVGSWNVAARHASLFGSFARGDADADSDLDVLLVAPPLDADEDTWLAQVAHLGEAIVAWTGNEAQIVEVSEQALAHMAALDDPLLESWHAEAVHLTGARLRDLLRGP